MLWFWDYTPVGSFPIVSLKENNALKEKENLTYFHNNRNYRWQISDEYFQFSSCLDIFNYQIKISETSFH